MTETKKNSVAKKNTAKKSTGKETLKKEVVRKIIADSKPAKVSATASKPTKIVAKPTEKKVVKSKKASDKTYATGKRKNAIAKVWLSSGTGKITINGKPASDYLKRAILSVIINQPFNKTENEGKFDIECSVLGGGLSGQAGAIKHAISIALQLLNPELRGTLKSAGFLTRDSRVVERKKAGLKKARKGQVYQKR